MRTKTKPMIDIDMGMGSKDNGPCVEETTGRTPLGRAEENMVMTSTTLKEADGRVDGCTSVSEGIRSQDDTSGGYGGDRYRQSAPGGEQN